MRNHVIASHGVNPRVTEPDLAAAVLAMPPADRIALARELLEGTGHRVTELRPACNVYDCQAVEGIGGAWNCGWPDKRCAMRQKAAMLGDEG